jgi:transposase InsO family protein
MGCTVRWRGRFAITFAGGSISRRATRFRSNGLFKTELIRRRGPWRSLEAVEFATLEWVDWFNHRRLLEPIGNMPPAEAEQRYYTRLQDTALAA